MRVVTTVELYDPRTGRLVALIPVGKVLNRGDTVRVQTATWLLNN